jgi:hypothetical protein
MLIRWCNNRIRGILNVLPLYLYYTSKARYETCFFIIHAYFVFVFLACKDRKERSRKNENRY